MLVCTERHRFYTSNQFAEAGISAGVGSHYESVCKEAYDVLDLPVITIGRGRSNDYIVTVRVSVQQNLKRGQQHHVQGGAFCPS